MTTQIGYNSRWSPARCYTGQAHQIWLKSFSTAGEQQHNSQITLVRFERCLSAGVAVRPIQQRKKRVATVNTKAKRDCVPRSDCDGAVHFPDEANRGRDCIMNFSRPAGRGKGEPKRRALAHKWGAVAGTRRLPAFNCSPQRQLTASTLFELDGFEIWRAHRANLVGSAGNMLGRGGSQSFHYGVNGL
jgi:hypothetical protein